MTFSVDDLVTSFNTGGHIGEEAIDIANLQSQLAQTLSYAQQQQQCAPRHALCNTPTTARTPTTSFGNWSAFEQHQQRTRSRSASTADGTIMETVNEDSPMDEDDERAVEQLLASPHSQMHTQYPLPRRRARGESQYMQQNHQHSYAFPQPPPSPSQTRHAYTGADPMSVSDCTSPVSTGYAASDPFFAAVAAAESARQNQSQIQQPQSSFFGQIGLPSQHSPFYAAAQSNAPGVASRYVSAGTVDS